MTEVAELLAGTRLLTLLVMGGLGKTRLALRIGAVIEKRRASAEAAEAAGATA